MGTFQIQLPFSRGSSFGIKHISSPQESLKQDFKMLLLTRPGEKINNPDYGCGLINFIFEKDNLSLRRDIESIIREKTDKYLPLIKITNISFAYDLDTVLNINIKFFIGSGNTPEEFNFKLNSIEE